MLHWVDQCSITRYISFSPPMHSSFLSKLLLLQVQPPDCFHFQTCSLPQQASTQVVDSSGVILWDSLCRHKAFKQLSSHMQWYSPRPVNKLWFVKFTFKAAVGNLSLHNAKPPTSLLPYITPLTQMMHHTCARIFLARSGTSTLALLLLLHVVYTTWF